MTARDEQLFEEWARTLVPDIDVEKSRRNWRNEAAGKVHGALGKDSMVVSVPRFFNTELARAALKRGYPNRNALVRAILGEFLISEGCDRKVIESVIYAVRTDSRPVRTDKKGKPYLDPPLWRQQCARGHVRHPGEIRRATNNYYACSECRNEWRRAAAKDGR